MENTNVLLEKENQEKKKMERIIFLLEENLEKKNKEIENELKLRKEISKKNEMIEIEIEELNIFNQEISEKLNQATEKLENQKKNLIKKENEFNDFKKSFREAKIINGNVNDNINNCGFALPQKVNLNEIFNDNSNYNDIDKNNFDNNEKKRNSLNLNNINFNDFNLNNNFNNDLDLYNTAVTLNSNSNSRTNLGFYFKNNNNYNNLNKKNISQIQSNKKLYGLNTLNNSINKEREKESEEKQRVNLDTLLSVFESEEKINSLFNPVDYKSNIYENFDNNYSNDKDVYNNNSEEKNKKIKSEGKKIDFYLNDNNNTNEHLSKKIIEYFSENFAIEIISKEKNNKFESDEIIDREKDNNNNNNSPCSHIDKDPLEEFFLLTFQSIRLNNNDFDDILSYIDPKIIYAEAKYLDLPFHRVIKFLFKNIYFLVY